VWVTRWPPEILEPPPDWERPWIGFITDYPLPWNTLDAAFVALTQFLDPLLAGTAADSDPSGSGTSGDGNNLATGSEPAAAPAGS
jgi:hypothetical protein